jgi:aspartate/methionine/tyrosine aminotransferase
LTTSTSESYGFLFKLLCDPGDEVLVPRPSYPLFEFLATLESVRVLQYPLRYYGDWSIDFEALERLLTERSRAVVLVNPNNPTGSFLKRNELERLVAICRERELAIISDEVFADYAFAEDSRRVNSLTGVDGALTFCLSGLSKVSALPQMKLGWIAVNGPGELRNLAFERLELIADTYLSVSAPGQHALSAMLDARIPVQAQMRARLRSNLEFLRNRICGSAARLLDVEGGWYASLRIPRVKSEEEWVLDLLDRCDLLVQPGYFYDFDSEAYLVLSLLTREDVFQAGVERLHAAI